MRKLLIASQKGGVGKTTAAINLASAIALSGGRALLVDADPLGGIAAALNLAAHRPAPGLRSLGIESPAPLWKDVVPGLDITTPYSDPDKPGHTLDEFLTLINTEQALTRYSWIILDAPPVIGGMQLRSLLHSSDELILVIRAEPMAFRTVPMFLQLIKMVQEDGSLLKLRGLLLTLPANEPLGGAWESELRRVFARSMLPQAIPHDEEVARAALLGKPVVAVNPQSLAAKQYTALALHLGLIGSGDNETIDIFTDAPAALTTPRVPHAPDAPPLERPKPLELHELLGAPLAEIIASLESTSGIFPMMAGVPLKPFTLPKSPTILQADTPVSVGVPSASTGSKDKPVKLWDTSASTDRTPARGHTGDITCLAFSPDGKCLATSSWDKTIKVWNLEAGDDVLTLKGHGGVVSSVAFSKNGETLASTSWDKTVRLWKASDGSSIGTLQGHTGVVTSVAFSADQSLLVSSGWDKTVRLWHGTDGTPISVLQGHQRMVTSVAISPDGFLFASGSWDKTVRVWAREGGPQLAALKGHSGDVTCVAFSPMGKILASAGLDHTIRLWDLETSKETAILRAHTGEVTSIAFAPDGKTIASVSWDRTVRIWEVATGHLQSTLTGHANVITSVAFAPDGTQVASVSLDRTVKFWDLSTGKEAGTLRVQTSNDAKTVAANFNPKETPLPNDDARTPSPTSSLPRSAPLIPGPRPSTQPMPEDPDDDDFVRTWTDAHSAEPGHSAGIKRGSVQRPRLQPGWQFARSRSRRRHGDDLGSGDGGLASTVAWAHGRSSPPDLLTRWQANRHGRRGHDRSHLGCGHRQ
ncbi:MAG: AAA family ATPase [Planctomycetes bacterium]|nr:AAA family ATPase [Planctomycetota bacterium]